MIVITGDWSHVHHAGTHIKHGLGNIVGGALESIPLIQTCLYGVRFIMDIAKDNVQVYVATNHQMKFMPYSSLVEADWEIAGASDDAVQNVRNQLPNNYSALSRHQQMVYVEDLIRKTHRPMLSRLRYSALADSKQPF